MSVRRSASAGVQRRGRPMGCFLVGVTGTDANPAGEALIGSISDDPYDIRTFLRVVRPEGAPRHIGTELVSTSERSLTERGYIASPGETTRGINEHGLAFTCSMVFEAAPESDRSQVSFVKVTEDLMQQCRTVPDALGMLESIGAVDLPVCVLLADANGDLAQVEAGSYGVGVHHHYTRRNPGVVFAVNCYISDKLVAHNDPNAPLDHLENNNFVRRQRGMDLAVGMPGALDVTGLARILSDHANCERDPRDNPLLEGWGYSICNHGTRRQDSYPPEDLPWGTVSSEILQPSERILWYNYGWPCGKAPEFGDQIYQDRSWGRFVPFALDVEGDSNDGTTVLATAEGEITRDGARHQGNRPAITAERWKSV